MIESEAAQSTIAAFKNSSHGAIVISTLLAEHIAIPIAVKLGQALFDLIKKLSHGGNTTVKKLLDSKRKLALFAIKEEDYLKFETAAKKRGVTFVAIRDKSTKQNGYIEVMSLEDQSGIIDHIIDTHKIATIDTEQFKKALEKEKDNSIETGVDDEKVKTLLQKHVTPEKVNLLKNEIEAREGGSENLNVLYKDYSLPELKATVRKIEEINITCEVLFSQSKEGIDKMVENKLKEMEEKGNPPNHNENQLSNNLESTSLESDKVIDSSENREENFEEITINKTVVGDYEIISYDGNDLTINKEEIIDSNVIKKDIEDKIGEVNKTVVGDYEIISHEGSDLEIAKEMVKENSLEITEIKEAPVNKEVRLEVKDDPKPITQVGDKRVVKEKSSILGQLKKHKDDPKNSSTKLTKSKTKTKGE